MVPDAVQGRSFDEPVRVEHVGSLIWPDALVTARSRHRTSELSSDATAEAVDQCVTQVVRAQERLGLAVVTDGELRRVGVEERVAAALSELDAEEPEHSPSTPPPDRTPTSPLVTTSMITGHWPLPLGGYGDGESSEISGRSGALAAEYRFAAALTDRIVKVSLLGPDYFAQALNAERYRQGFRQILEEAVSVERLLIEEVVAAGCNYVQIDAPGYLAYTDLSHLAQMRGHGGEPLATMKWSIAADNAVIAGFGAVTFGLHLCRGARASAWGQAGSYEGFAELLFGGPRHQRILLECDPTSKYCFTQLRFVPDDKVVVLGLVDPSSSRIETVDELVRAVDLAGRWIDTDQLGIGPMCGFASAAGLGGIRQDDQWRKLEVLVEAAAKVWG